MRYLVTGGAGFIGSCYVRALLGGAFAGCEDARVTVLDKLTYAGNPANLGPVAGHRGLTFVHGDILDGRLLADLMPGHDVVVHFAAESHVDRSIGDSGGFVETNVLGTHRLLQAALDSGVRTFLNVSTDEVYGSIADGSWPETDPLLPNSPYAASKASADLLCRSFHRTHGMDVRITRCSNNYGPYQFPEKVIPLFVTTLLDGGRVPLYGDGRNVREWLHVEDHCRAIQLVLEKGSPGEIYNVGGGSELTNAELTRRLLAACGVGADRVERVADRLGHDLRYSVDSTKIRSLGFEPAVGFDEGLEQTVAWYRGHEEWWRPALNPAGDHR
jgi:dTDP-glucose 4,6-dehydratase